MEALGPTKREYCSCLHEPGRYEVFKYDFHLTDSDLAKYFCAFAHRLMVIEYPRNDEEFTGPYHHPWLLRKLPRGRFLVPFSYDGPYVYVRTVDDGTFFGGQAWKIYSRWLDNATPAWPSQNHLLRGICLPRIKHTDVHHPDHVPFAYNGIPDSSRLSAFQLWRDRLIKDIPDPYENPEKEMNDWEIEENRQRPENLNPYDLVN